MTVESTPAPTATTTTTTTSAATPVRETRRGSGRSGLLALCVIGLVLLGGALAWSLGAFTPKLKVALVTSGDGPYWDPVIAGARQAADRLDLDLTVVRVRSDVALQSQKISELAEQKLHGMAVSPIEPRTEAALLSKIASEMTLVTFDSDAPVSRRLCFVGTDNYAAGRQCGELVRRALPEGGDVIILVGNPEKENTQRRRQGVIEELLAMPYAPEQESSAEPSTAPTVKHNVVATVADESDPNLTVERVTEAVQRYPNVRCFVATLGYQTPALLKALEQAGKLGQVRIIGFDADERTLAGIEAGHVFATIVQDQFACGYQAVRILADELRGNRGGLPLFQTYPLAVHAVTKDNLTEARAQLASAGAAPAGQQQPAQPQQAAPK